MRVGRGSRGHAPRELFSRGGAPVTLSSRTHVMLAPMTCFRPVLFRSTNTAVHILPVLHIMPMRGSNCNAAAQHSPLPSHAQLQ